MLVALRRVVHPANPLGQTVPRDRGGEIAGGLAVAGKHDGDDPARVSDQLHPWRAWHRRE